jgi:integrase
LKNKEEPIMRGSIRKRGTSYQIRVNLGVDPVTCKNKEISKSGFKTKKEAEKALNELINSIESGTFIEDKKVLLKDIFELWLDTAKTSVEQSTYCFYEDIVYRILIKELGNIPALKINSMQVQKFLNKYINEKKLSPTTVRHYYNTLNIALNYAKKHKVIRDNPCEDVDPPKPKKGNIAVLDLEQVHTLLKYTKTSVFPFMYMPILLAVTCGMRRGEILGLKWSNVDLDNAVISITAARVKAGKQTVESTPKTGSSIRKIDLLPSTIEIFKQWEKQQRMFKWNLGEDYLDEDYVCTWSDGRPLKPDYISQTSSIILKKANLPHIRFHDLRHTHATLLLLNNTNPKIVAERLGHKDVYITLDTYSHLLPTMQKGAAKDLDNMMFNII